MIGSRPRLGKGFGGLQKYLLHGRNGAAPDRSVWASTRNLPPGDPEQTAGIMRSTANRSERVEKPVYHLSVSMAPGERLERGELERVADRLLADLGLEGHQALVAEHADGAQQHIHLMVNRVHPETGKAWSAWRDYERIEASLRGQERELGLRVVPGRHAGLEHERYVGTRLGVGGFAGEARELAGDVFREAGSWQELHASLSGKGLTLQPSRSGRGLVVTDGRRYAAVSKVAREASRSRLEGRLGRFETASPDLKKVQELARELEQRGRLVSMRTRFESAARGLAQDLADHKKAVEGVERASGKLDRALERSFRDPAAARRGIEKALERRGGEWTARSVSEKPKAYGQLRGRVASRERKEAREVTRRELPKAIRSLAAAREHELWRRQRLEPFRRNPDRPLLQAAGKAQKVLWRGLKRLEAIDRRWASHDALGKQAAAVVRRLGWEAVSRVIPGPAHQMLQVAISLAKMPGKVLDRGLDR